jgi:predicted phage tail protein
MKDNTDRSEKLYNAGVFVLIVGGVMVIIAGMDSGLIGGLMLASGFSMIGFGLVFLGLKQFIFKK